MVRQALLIAGLAALVGCSSNPPGPAAAPTDTAQPSGGAGPATTATAAAAAPPPKIDAKTVDDCKAVAAAATGADPSANVAAATGSSERSAAMNALMAEKRPGFRCC